MGKTVAQNRKARHDYVIEDTARGGHRPDRHRDQVASAKAT